MLARTHPQVDIRIKHHHRRVEDERIFHLSHEFVILAAFWRTSEVLQVNAAELRRESCRPLVDRELATTTIRHLDLTRHWRAVVGNVLLSKDFNSCRRRIPVQTETCAAENTANAISVSQSVRRLIRRSVDTVRLSHNKATYLARVCYS